MAPAKRITHAGKRGIGWRADIDERVRVGMHELHPCSREQQTMAIELHPEKPIVPPFSVRGIADDGVENMPQMAT